MKWLPTALLIAIAPVSIVHSGTFLDDFHDRNLEGGMSCTRSGFQSR